MDNQGLLEEGDITISFPSKLHRKNEDPGTPIPTLVGSLIVGVPIMRIMELVGAFDSFSYNEADHDFVPSEGGGICGGYGVTISIIRQGDSVATIHLHGTHDMKDKLLDALKGMFSRRTITINNGDQVPDNSGMR